MGTTTFSGPIKAGTIKETRASALDPVMSDILDEIELRAKIELAKFEDG